MLTTKHSLTVADAEAFADSLAEAVEAGAILGREQFAIALGGGTPNFNTDTEADWSGLVALTGQLVHNELVDRENAVRAERKSSNAAPKNGDESPPMRYRGSWHGTAEFSPGDVVTDGGQLWHCAETTWSRPPGAAWILMHKGLVKR